MCACMFVYYFFVRLLLFLTEIDWERENKLVKQFTFQILTYFIYANKLKSCRNCNTTRLIAQTGNFIAFNKVFSRYAFEIRIDLFGDGIRKLSIITKMCIECKRRSHAVQIESLMFNFCWNCTSIQMASTNSGIIVHLSIV